MFSAIVKADNSVSGDTPSLLIPAVVPHSCRSARRRVALSSGLSSGWLQEMERAPGSWRRQAAADRSINARHQQYLSLQLSTSPWNPI